MNKHLSTEELANLSVELPTMSRAEKLMRWADVLRERKGRVYMASNLEHMLPDARNSLQHEFFPWTIASNDPILKDAGLAGPTYGDAKKFFELTDADIHAFTCNCGGEITRDSMANRIEVIARSGLHL